MKLFAMCLVLMAAALMGCMGFEDEVNPGAPDVTVVDNTPLPDVMPDVPDLGQPDVGVDLPEPDVTPDLGVDVTPDVPEVCTPDCKGKACGDDGCGGECSVCPVMACKGKAECVDNNCQYTPVVCDDGNACTNDVCDEATSACVYDAVVCDDGDLCSMDSCDVVKGCESTPKDCTQEPGVNGCWTGFCDPTTGGCGYQPVVCDDGNPCTTDSCDKDQGCVYIPDTCDDGNACTNDVCDVETGYCQNVLVICNDGLDYTTDYCNQATGGCESVVIAGTCLKDTDCADGNPCTEDVCNSITRQCNLVQMVCDDGNSCTIEKCQPAPIGVLGYICVMDSWKDCDDDDSCTWDFCNADTGVCSHEQIPNCCANDDDCGIDSWCNTQDQDGRCWQLNCVSDECGGYAGNGNHHCEEWSASQGTICDDHNSTTIKSVCDGQGNCVPVPPKSCDDGDKFTEDWLDPATDNCQHAEKVFAVSCEVPTNLVATGRYCEIWIGWGSASQDIFYLKEKGEKVPARAICGSSWSPSQSELNVRVFGTGAESGPWAGGIASKLTDPDGTAVVLHEVLHPWANPSNYGTPTDGIPWCK